MTQNLKYGLSAMTLATAFIATPSPVQAKMMDEIITTAQRTEQNLQDVPVSVTAVTLAEIESRQVYDVLDLQALVPNINMATNTGTSNAARIFLRGVGEDESRGAVDQAVGIYVDGVYIGRSVGSLFDLVDLQSIEVLRGPQGTLYGRNSNGGAIKLTSVKPQLGENGGDVRLTLGNHDRQDIRGMANFALGENSAVRATAMYRSRDGFHTVKPNGPRANFARNVGKQDVTAGRLQFMHDFGNDWDILLSVDRTVDGSDPIPDSIAPGSDADNNIFTIEPAPGTTCPATGGFLGFSLGCFAEYENETTSQGLNATINGVLGTFDLTSITAYREMEDDLVTRIGFPYSQQTDQDQTSQEFVLSSNFGGAFEMVGGLFFFNEDLKLNSTFIFPFSIESSTKSIAAFGQGVFAVNDRLDITAGLRVTKEEKDFNGQRVGSAFARNESRDFDNVSYTLKADYDLTDDVMLYVSYATGFKSGGWSPDAFNAAGVFLPVDEEEVGTFELGARTQFWDNRAQINLTYFASKYDDLQIGASVPGSSFAPPVPGNVFTRFNVNETEIQGLEAEWRFALNERFNLSGNLGLLDAEYQDVNLFQAAGLTAGGASCPGGVVTVACALDLELKNAPSYKATVAADYSQPAYNGEISVSGDISFEDSSWSLVANSPPHALAKIPTLLNGRIKYADDNGWSVAVWSKNMLDNEYYRAASGTALTTYASEPLTFGVDLGYTF